MSLSILNISPNNSSISVPVDTKISIKFNEPIDEFTVSNGINLYAITDDGSGDIISPPLKFNVNNDTVELYADGVLLSNKTYYLSVFPGDDSSRFISTKTTSEPTYDRVGSSVGTINIKSAYTGLLNGDYELSFTDSLTFDLSLGIEYIGSFTFENGIVNIGNLVLEATETFDQGDVVNISVFKASGLSDLYKISFTTSSYITILPTSQIITDDSIEDFEYQFKVINTIPDRNSVNNLACNPITIKFNKDISPDQDIINKINIKRTDLVTGGVKNLNYKYKINNNILKIYLISG